MRGRLRSLPRGALPALLRKDGGGARGTRLANERAVVGADQDALGGTVACGRTSNTSARAKWPIRRRDYACWGYFPSGVNGPGTPKTLRRGAKGDAGSG